MMNKIKRILCIVFMLVIVLIIVICMLIKDLENKDTEKENEDFSNYGGDVKPKEYNNGFDDVNDSRIFFSVVDAVKKYEKICRVNTEIDYSNEYFDEDEYLDNIKSEQLRNKAIYDLLDKEYIKREAITVDNVSKVMFDIDSDTIILPKEKHFDKLKVVSVASLLAKTIESIENNLPGSDVFQEFDFEK